MNRITRGQRSQATLRRDEAGPGPESAATALPAAVPGRAAKVAVAGLSLALGLTLGSSPVAADSGAATASDASADSQLAEVVVTAEKRESTVQKTPFSLTAVSGDELASRGISSVAGLIADVPGISVRSAGPGQSELEMRGLSSSGGAAPTVGFYLDDTPLTPPVAALNGKVVVDPDLYDLARAEVLRGPQGTLYGSGSMGGTIRLITNQPEMNKFYGSADVDGSGTKSGGANGSGNLMLNIPVIDDKVALRVVGTDKYVSGWLDRVYENPFPLPTNNGCTPTPYYGCARGNVLAGNVVDVYKNVNWERLQGGRVELLVTPTDNLKIETNAMYQRITQGGPNTFDSPPGIVAGKGAHYEAENIAEPFADTFYLVGNTITYDLEWARLSAATSYWHRQEKQTQEIGDAIQELFVIPTYYDTQQMYVYEHDTSKQFSEELRLASEGSGPFQWIGGVFFSDMHSLFNSGATVQAICYLSVGGCAANPTGLLYYANNPYHIEQFAAFGEASYQVTPTVKATLGARYFDFHNSITFYQSGIDGQYGNTTPTVGGVSSRNSGATPKVNLAYEPTDHLTVYGTVSEGFRPGGVNLPVPVTGGDSCLPALQAIGLTEAPPSYGPDKVWNYEVGEKAKLLDNRLTINADVYYIKWKQIQEPITLACGYPYTANAGDAATYGPEIEAAFRITPELSLEATYTYTHASLTSVVADSGFQDGERLLNIPKYTETTSLVYRHSLTDTLDMTARLSNSLVGPTLDQVYTFVQLPTYDIVNARLELQRGQIGYSLYVNNLTDKRAEITANNTEITGNIPTLTRFSTNQPLTVGLDLNFRF
jgi:iron complex outermembrane recepter protein